MDDGEIAEAMGHAGFTLGTLRDGRLYVECSCGYRSAGRQTAKEAVGAAQHHVRKEAAEARRQGVSPRALARSVRLSSHEGARSPSPGRSTTRERP